MAWLAHRSPGRDEPLETHLAEVGAMAGAFAAVFGGEAWGRAVLTGTAYPRPLLSMALERMRSEHGPYDCVSYLRIALGTGLNATIKDRDFGAVLASPGAVFPNLIRLAQHHLSTADAGWLDKQIGDIVDAPPAPFRPHPPWTSRPTFAETPQFRQPPQHVTAKESPPCGGVD